MQYENSLLYFFSVVLAALWISLFELFRNDILLKSLWVEYCRVLGLIFPSALINGVMWGVWSLLCSIGIYFLRHNFLYGKLRSYPGYLHL